MNLVRPQTWSHFLKIWKVTPRRTVTRTPRNPVRRSTKSCIKRFKIRIKPNFYMFTFTAWPWLCRGAGCSCRRGSRRWRRSARCPRGRRSRGRRSPRRRSRRSNRWATFFQNQITKSTFIQINFQNFLNLWTLQARYTVRYTNFAHRLFTVTINDINRVLYAIRSSESLKMAKNYSLFKFGSRNPSELEPPSCHSVSR